MVFGREPSVWHNDKYALRDADHLAHEELLVRTAADVFEDRIRCRDIEMLVGKRQRPVRPDLAVSHLGKGRPKRACAAEPRCSDAVRIWILSLDQIRGLVDDV